MAPERRAYSAAVWSLVTTTTRSSPRAEQYAREVFVRFNADAVTLSPLLSLVMLISVPLLAWSSLRYGKRSRPAFLALRDRVADTMTSLQEGLTGVRVVQSFGLRPGDIVAPNQTVAEILESSQLWVRIYVPETMLGLLHVNQNVRVRVDTYPNQWFAGRIGTIAAQGEYTPRNVQTRAQRAEEVFGVKVIVDPDPKLHAGMAAEVDLGVKTKEGQ